MTVHQGETTRTVDYRTRLKEFRDVHYDVLTFFPALVGVCLAVAVWIAFGGLA